MGGARRARKRTEPPPSTSSLNMRLDIPPPGKAKPFDEWARAIVAAVREYLPDIRAVRKGARLVIIRHAER
jgi:hypothetical protein